MNVSISNESAIIDIIYDYFGVCFALPLPKNSNDQLNQNSMGKLKKQCFYGDMCLQYSFAFILCLIFWRTFQKYDRRTSWPVLVYAHT